MFPEITSEFVCYEGVKVFSITGSSRRMTSSLPLSRQLLSSVLIKAHRSYVNRLNRGGTPLLIGLFRRHEREASLVYTHEDEHADIVCRQTYIYDLSISIGLCQEETSISEVDLKPAVSTE